MGIKDYYGFGSAQAYADAIREKEAAGKALSNPTAAAAFKQTSPGLFGATQPAPAVKPVAKYELPAYQPKTYNTLDYNTALGQAGQQYNPMRDQDRESAGVINQQQANLLRQAMNARGQLGGGLHNQQAGQQSMDFQRLLQGINTNYNTKAAELAQSLVQRSQDRADQLSQQDYQNYLGQQGLNMQAFGVNQGIEQDTRDFAYRQGQDTLTNERALAALTGYLNGNPTLQQQQWQSSPESQDWYLPTYKKGLELDNALAQHELNRPYFAPSSGGGGGSGGSSGSSGPQTAGERVNYNTADAYDAVGTAVKQGLNADEIVKNIEGQRADLTRAGVDIDAIIEYVYSVAPAAPAPAKKQSWYTKLDQNKLGGWLPFGASR